MGFNLVCLPGGCIWWEEITLGLCSVILPPFVLNMYEYNTEYTSHNSQVTIQKSQVITHKSQVTSHNLQFTSHKSKVKSHKSKAISQKSQLPSRTLLLYYLEMHCHLRDSKIVGIWMQTKTLINFKSIQSENIKVLPK